MFISWLLIFSVLTLIPTIWERMHYTSNKEVELDSNMREFEEFIYSLGLYLIEKHNQKVQEQERMALPLSGDNPDDCD
jgi:hypothetical protein